MGVTIVVCAKKGCFRALNGETCTFIGGKPYCYEHVNMPKCYRLDCSNPGIQKYRKPESYGEVTCAEHQYKAI